MRASLAALALACGLAFGASAQESFRFRSGVELINVTATVTDDRGRFVSGLRAEDFIVYDDDEPQTISHFSAERVPVSLGFALDTSGSMTSDKMSAAQGAIERFMDTLLGPGDEMFLLQFSNRSELVQPWTDDRRAMSRALRVLSAHGGTALYSGVAEAIPIAQSGRNTKKALVIISDGNDTGSGVSPSDVRRLIRDSDVLVYAVGIDGVSRETFTRRPPVIPRIPLPVPFPGGRRQPRFPPIGGGGPAGRVNDTERVNAVALRGITDDTGGRTEIVRDAGDLAGATGRIADELTKQYYLGYASSGEKDGRWHSIRVEVRHRNLTVRARKGYVAS
jgi:Ca-activated chloride channel family protein